MNTYEPYQEIARPRLRFFTGLAAAELGTVVVVDREGLPPRALRNEERLTAGEVRWGGVRTLYRVDVGEHLVSFTQRFPARGDVGGFVAEVTLTTRVDDPEAVVQRRITDVAGVLAPRVSETIRRVCRDFEAEDFHAAEDAALARVRTLERDEPHDAAISIVHIALVLGLDDRAGDYVGGLKDDERTRVRQASRSEVDQEAAQAALLIQDIRLGHISKQLLRGPGGLLALRLAQDPDSIEDVVDVAGRQRAESLARDLEMLRTLVDSDSIEGWELNEHAKALVRRLAQHGQEVLGIAEEQGEDIIKVVALEPEPDRAARDSG